MQEFFELAFAQAGLDWRKYVVVDDRFYRPAEVELLIGNATKAREVLGWRPSYTFEELVKEMVQADLAVFDKTSIAASSWLSRAAN